MPLDALRHAGAVVVAYVDSDEDSCPDDPLVSRSMRQQNATLVMFRNPKEDSWDSWGPKAHRQIQFLQFAGDRVMMGRYLPGRCLVRRG